MIVDPEVGDIFYRGLRGLDELEPGETTSFMSILSSISRTLESFLFQKERGELESQLFEGWFQQYLDLHANPGVVEFWNLRKHQYSREFVEYLDRRLASRDAKPLYPAGVDSSGNAAVDG